MNKSAQVLFVCLNRHLISRKCSQIRARESVRVLINKPYSPIEYPSSHKQKTPLMWGLKVVKIYNQYLIAVPLTLTINIEPVSPNVP